jgi:hypothetical protein
MTTEQLSPEKRAEWSALGTRIIALPNEILALTYDAHATTIMNEKITEFNALRRKRRELSTGPDKQQFKKTINEDEDIEKAMKAKFEELRTHPELVYEPD